MTQTEQIAGDSVADGKHLTIRNMKDGRYELHCGICEVSIVPDMPCPTDKFMKHLDEFERGHAHQGEWTIA